MESYTAKENILATELSRMQSYIPDGLGDLIGVYKNNKSSHIVMTTLGIILIEDGNRECIAYDNIKDFAFVRPENLITSDKNYKMSHQAIRFDLASSGEFVLPILNGKETTRDVFEFYRLMRSIWRWTQKSIHS